MLQEYGYMLPLACVQLVGRNATAHEKKKKKKKKKMARKTGDGRKDSSCQCCFPIGAWQALAAQLKNVRANCFWGSLLRTQIHMPRHASSARAKY